MTIEEKRKALEEYCDTQVDCSKCALHGYWKFCDGCCKDMIAVAYEEDLDRALKRIGQKESVNHPSHYNQGKYECIEVMVETFGIEAAKNFCLLNAFKYIWRTGEKNGREDIEKAVWYLNKYLEVSR